MSSMGAGAVVGSLVAAAARDPTVGRVRVLAVIFGLSWAAVGLVPTLAIGNGVAALMGAAASLLLSACAGSLQLRSDEVFRGRVMALYSVAFLGTAPIGGPAMGYIGQVFGPRVAFVVGGGMCVLAPLVGALFGEARDRPSRTV
jgi:MFS family permease